MRQCSRAAARGFVAVVIVSLWLLSPIAQPAQAVSCATTTGWLIRDKDATNKFGVTTSNNATINPASDCPLIRSQYIWNDTDNIVEVGWFEDGTSGSLFKCDNETTPHVLVYAIVNGFIKCKPGTPSLSGASDYSFRVSNPDHDFDFHYEWDSDTTPTISLGYFATDHSNGYPQTGDERKNTNDSLRADFSGMNTLGGGGGWNPYPSPNAEAVGNESGWQLCSWSGNYLHVRSSGGC